MSFTTMRFPWGHKREKKAHFEILSLLALSPVLTPWKNSILDSLHICQSNQCIRKRALGQSLGHPRDQGQRNRSR